MKRNFSVRRTWERIRTIPGLGRNLVTVMVLIVLGLVATSTILGNQRFIPPWEDRYVFSADFASAPGVNPGQQPKVRIAGVEVGQVTESTVTESGNARLRISFEPGHDVYRNAHMVLRPTNPLNEMYIEVDPGEPPAAKLKPGELIPVSQTSRPVQPDEVLNHLDGRARSAVSNLLAASDVALASAPENLPQGLNAAHATMTGLRPVLEGLQQRRSNIARLVTALSKISTAVGHNDSRLTGLMNATEQTLSALSERSGDLEAALGELPGAADALRRSMDGIGGLTAQLDPTLDNVKAASERLPATLREVGTVVDELGRTVDTARPVVDAAGPVIKDLRPLVGNVHDALGDLQPLSRNLVPDTEVLVSYLNHVQAFIYNTNGAFSLSDANGGFIRGHVAVPMPDAGVLPGTHGGNTGREPK